jgi:hypothetical protein
LDPFTFFGKLLERLDSQLVGIVPIAAFVEKFLIDLLKKFLGVRFQGNMVATLLGATTTGYFDTVHTWRGYAGLLFVAVLCYLSAVGLHETFSDSNDPKVRPENV